MADINSAHNAESGRQPFLLHHAPLSMTSGRLEQPGRNHDHLRDDREGDDQGQDLGSDPELDDFKRD